MNRFLLGILCLLLCPAVGLGDAMVRTQAMTAPTIAEVFVENDIVRVEVEIGMSDIPGFRNILPDDIYEKMGYAPLPIARRIDRFFAEDFVLEADGKPVRGGIGRMEARKRIKRDPITGEPLPDGGDDENVLYAEFVFPEVGRPGTIALKPPSDERGMVSASIGLMVYHQGLPVMDFRYLSQKEVLRLDWADPWYSRFENRNLWRQYNEPISVFIYAESFETRVEVIVRPRDIQQWHDLGLAGLEAIPVALQPEVKEEIAAFLLTEMQLVVDERSTVPELKRINFLRRTLKSSVVIDPPEDLDTNSATLGIIYSVPTAALPQEVRLTWNLFSPKLQEVRAACTDEAGPLPFRLRPDDNVLIWKNFLKNPTVPTIKPLAPPPVGRQIKLPVISLLCFVLVVPAFLFLHRRKSATVAGLGGAVLLVSALVTLPVFRIPVTVSGPPDMTDEAARELLSGLLENVYTSFDFRDESTIYDALDQSLAGDLLTDVYLQTMKSLELASQGGARAKVKGIRLEEAEFQSLDQGVIATCVWDVMGSVGHWGHIHQRINRYRADLEIEAIDGQWKIANLEVLEEQRVK